MMMARSSARTTATLAPTAYAYHDTWPRTAVREGEEAWQSQVDVKSAFLSVSDGQDDLQEHRYAEFGS